MENLLRDVRYGVRMLLREPGFSLLAILALALGTGATTAIFTVVDSVLFRPLPYKDPGRLVVTLHGPTANNPVSPADYLDYRRDARSFERRSAAQAWGVTLGTDRRGTFAVVRLPSRKSCRKFLARTKEWLSGHGHWKRRDQQRHLTTMLRGVSSRNG